MYVFFISKGRIAWFLMIILLLIMGFVFCSYFVNKTQPTINPIFMGDTQEKAVAFMFNVDWGEEILPDLLEVLKEEKVTATFFISGKFAKKFPQLVANIAENGHEIGNHGYSHPHPDKLSVEQNMKEITDTEKVFQEIKINSAKIFAPPYGEHGQSVLKAADSLGYKTIMWTLDTIDWQDPTPEVILNRILPKVDHGSLILMHPKSCTLQALPGLIKSLRDQDYQFKKVTEIIKS
ncbi:MAG: polysaccharide deacetylase family protein [Clostridia bacterium]|jgi:probable sporulation protein (polysaccharide deacetylase family)|nr:polysaccharide deacetylase family protein [Clostridia bacterium]